MRYSFLNILKRVFFTIICILVTNFSILSQSKDSLVKISNSYLEEIKVTSSRISESILKSSLSIEKIKLNDLKNSTSLNAFEILENIKGVHIITPSIGFKVVNSGGFSNTTNVRFAQLVDGVDNQAPHIGAPIANTLGANDLDIEEIEFLSGVASVLYGMNSINGLVNFKTKSPFIYQGLSIQTINGLNHIGNVDKYDPKLYNQTNFRFAKAFNSKIAFKVNFSINKGKDWVADNRDDLAFDKNYSLGLIGLNNPAYDEVNSYGNESSNRRTLTLNGKKIVVARTGYRESEIDDYNIQNLKGDISINFKTKIDNEFSICYKNALINNIYQRSNRFRLKEYNLQQFSLSFTSKIIDFKSYLTYENTGKSYNLRSLAENMDRAFKTDDIWYNDFTNSFNSLIINGADLNEALKTARSSADDGRYIPGSHEYNEKKSELININNWDIGAALKVKSYLSHSEILVNWHKIFPKLLNNKGFQILSALDYRCYFIIPDGNYFINPIDTSGLLTYKKIGGFTQINKILLKSKLKLSFTLRADKSDYFDLKLNPRLSALYTLKNKTNFRFSAQSGYRFPSIFEGFSNVNSGGVKRVGGLKIMSNGVFENSFTKSSIESFQSNVINDVNSLNISQATSIEKNKNILKKNPYNYLKPEHINSFEFGVRSLSLNDKLFIDFNLFYNIYDNFIAQVEVSIPKTDISDSIPYYLFNKSKQEKYRLWTNSKSKIYTYGSSLGIKYKFNKILSANSNVNFSKLYRTENQDGLEDGFNTPPIIFNLGFVLENFWKNLSFSMMGKYQSKYDYVSFLISGKVPEFWTIDSQINFNFKKYKINFKIGANNLFNKAYYSILGGPNIGGLYYVSVVYQ